MLKIDDDRTVKEFISCNIFNFNSICICFVIKVTILFLNETFFSLNTLKIVP